MNTGQFRICIISMLMVLVVCGTGVADAWDCSEYTFDNGTIHISNAAQHDTDMGEMEFAKVVHSTVCICSRPIPVPTPVISITSPSAPRINHTPLLDIIASFPSRASPA